MFPGWFAFFFSFTGCLSDVSSFSDSRRIAPRYYVPNQLWNFSGSDLVHNEVVHST